MKSLLLLSTLAFSLLSAPLLTADDNLLKNPELEQAEDGKAPKGWKTYSNKQKISTDKKEAPDGSNQSLRVDLIADGGKALGQIVQKIPVKEKTDYVLKLDMKSSKSGIGVGQVKLMSLRSELKRIPTETSSKNWSTIELEFNSGNADNILVLLRYKQKEGLIGETVWFANPVLIEKK
ncbi:hypothetical protein P0Y35_07605 [Kiritimatiellaeota bacterium B1221]|nr:hypothetical protein [Kiritimatiellaeota bacterium B1221]